MANGLVIALENTHEELIATRRIQGTHNVCVRASEMGVWSQLSSRGVGSERDGYMNDARGVLFALGGVDYR